MIKVTAKAQNAAALGVMYAYVQLNPGVSLEELRSTFPNNIAPDKGVNELFLPLEDAVAYNTQSNMNLYFVKDNRPITLADGTKIALAQLWTAKSLSRLQEVAQKFGIEVCIDKNLSKELAPNGFVIDNLKPATPIPPTSPKKKGCLGVVLCFLLGIGLLSVWAV